MAKSEIVLGSEQAAWELLERALNRDERLEDAKVTFKSWPKLEITVRGRDLDGTIPARFLPALLECQESVYKIYSYAKYKEYSTRRLKDEEKRQLELVYKVEKGSSDFAAQAAEALQKIATEAAAKMTPMQLTIFLCLVALLFAGHSGFKLWLRHKESKNSDDLKGRMVDALAESNRLLAESSRANASRDAERDVLLKKAISTTRGAKLAYESASDAYTRLALSMDPEDKLVVGNVELPGRELRSAVTTPRKASSRYTRDGAAILRSVEVDAKQGYIVGVKFLDTEFWVHAKIERTRLTDEEVQCISKAMFSGKAIWVHVEGKDRRGNIVDATIRSVRNLSAKERASVSKAQGGTRED